MINLLKVIAKCEIKKGALENFKETAAELVKETRKESGNFSYSLYQDINESNVISFIEEWESEKDLELHMETEHFKRIVPNLDKLQTSESKVNVYKLIL